MGRMALWCQQQHRGFLILQVRVQLPPGPPFIMNEETKILIEKARFIGRTFGVENERIEAMARCACYIKDSTSTLMFQTPHMLIVVGVDTLEMSITKRINDNPVVVSDARGKVYRFHGEFVHVVDEIKAAHYISTGKLGEHSQVGKDHND